MVSCGVRGASSRPSGGGSHSFIPIATPAQAHAQAQTTIPKTVAKDTVYRSRKLLKGTDVAARKLLGASPDNGLSASVNTINDQSDGADNNTPNVVPAWQIPMVALTKDIFVAKDYDASTVEGDTEAAIAASAANGAQPWGNTPGTPDWANPTVAHGKDIGDSKAVTDESSAEIDQASSIDSISTVANGQQ